MKMNVLEYSISHCSTYCASLCTEKCFMGLKDTPLEFLQTLFKARQILNQTIGLQYLGRNGTYSKYILGGFSIGFSIIILLAQCCPYWLGFNSA